MSGVCSDDNVDVIPTPDHTIEDISLLLRNTQLGTVVVVGDLFHCEEDCEDPSLWRSRIQNTVRHEVNWQRILRYHGTWKDVQDVENLIPVSPC